MALTQFNEWEPRLDPVTGIEAQEPRVFAHDAVAVVIGAINNSHSNHGITMTSGGTGYAVDMELTMTGGTGTGAKVTVKAINAPTVTVLNNDLISATTTNQTDFVNGTYTGTVGTTAGYSTSGSGTGLIITVTVEGNTATKVNVDSVGTGFAAGDTITITGSGGGILGGGTGNLVLTVGKGSVKDYEVSTVGSGYAVGNNLTQSGASSPAGGLGFTCTVSNIDIPNTQKRGACIYVGAGIASLVVVMESGNTATFKSVSAGSILPLLIKRVVSGISVANDVIALY